MIIIATAVGLLALTCPPGDARRGADVPTDDEIRELLRPTDDKQLRQYLIALGEKAFPAYKRILADPHADEAGRIFSVLTVVKADPHCFLEQAITGLTHSDFFARLTAAGLLARIGSAHDAAPVVALLSDKRWEVPFAAAKTLAVIGDQRTLTAMDVWLNSAIHRDNAAEYEAQRKHIAKCRDELKQRLDKQKKQPGK